MIERFMRLVRVDESTGCWIWRGHFAHGGTPIFRPYRRESTSARRWLYEHRHGELRRDQYVTYDCDDPRCVLHAKALTKAGYMAAARARGRNYHDARWRAQLTAGKRAHSRINWSIVRELRQRYEAGEYQIDLAHEYGLTKAHVWRIVHGLCWKETPTTGIAAIAHQAGML